jgi:hypothetical protein
MCYADSADTSSPLDRPRTLDCSDFLKMRKKNITVLEKGNPPTRLEDRNSLRKGAFQEIVENSIDL